MEFITKFVQTCIKK